MERRGEEGGTGRNAVERSCLHWEVGRGKRNSVIITRHEEGVKWEEREEEEAERSLKRRCDRSFHSVRKQVNKYNDRKQSIKQITILNSKRVKQTDPPKMTEK